MTVNCMQTDKSIVKLRQALKKNTFEEQRVKWSGSGFSFVVLKNIQVILV